MIGAEEIRRAVDALGLSGLPVCLHASLRSFGWVSGGADGIVDGFLAAGVTLLVPTFSASVFAAPAPAGHRPLPFNCEGDGSIPARVDRSAGVPFQVSCTDIDPEMGAIPVAVLARDGARRGNHPLSSFTAIGPEAAELVAAQSPEEVFAPLWRLARYGGGVVLAGTDLSSATILHLAEQRAGLRLLVRWAYGPDGRTIEVRHGGCSRGFVRLAGALAEIQRDTLVGPSRWRVFKAAEMLSLATAAFGQDAGAGICSNTDCCRCRDQVAYATTRAG